MATPRCGFIGLGEMGKWMALNMARAGRRLTVYDIRPEPVAELAARGAAPGENPAAVAAVAEVVFLSLPDTQVVESVIFGQDGLINGLSRGAVVVDLSTIDYLAALRIAEELQASGVTFVDAPVSGMEPRAKAGTLTVMVGGDPAVVEKIRPMLDAIGDNIVYMGASGNGQLTKLVNQLFLNISTAAMAEVLPMAVKLGLDPERLSKVVSRGTGQTYAFDFFVPFVLENNFEPGYPLKRAYKDMECATEISSKMKIPLPVFSAAMHTYQLALAQGLGGENKSAMIKVWEKVLGVKVRKK
jgi:3-hydroxyisobutyrate dehydrogenase-like beta-hydroxyacid dehydrogenase